MAYTGYLLTAAALTFSVLGRGITWSQFACSAASRLHARTVTRLLGAPMWWFDATPVGRILNR